MLDLLWKEYNRRSDYVRYLVRARQKLLGALAHIRVDISISIVVFNYNISVCREQAKEPKKAVDVISYQ